MLYQQKFLNKKLLTKQKQSCILIKVMKIADRKVGIHLTLAQLRDHGSYLSVHSRRRLCDLDGG